MSYRMSNNGQDKEPCNSNDSLGYDLETGEPITEIVPCSTTTTSTTTIATTTEEPTTTTTTTEEVTTTTSTTTSSSSTTTTTTTTEVPTTTTTTTSTTSTGTTSSATATEAPTTTTTAGEAVSEETGEETEEKGPTSSTTTTTTEATTTTTTVAPATTTTTIANNQRDNETNENQAETGNENAEETPANEIEVDSFYTCSVNNQDVLEPPEGAIQLDLIYDYEVYTVSTNGDSANEEQELGTLLKNMENQMAYDLAEASGLVNCNVVNEARRTLQLRNEPRNSDMKNGNDEKKTRESRTKKRRHLRNERRVKGSEQDGEDESALANGTGGGSGDVLAIDAEPIDISIADQYQCESQPDYANDSPPNTVCTPMRGYMTAWLAPDADPLVNERSLLSLIEKEMQSGSYTTPTPTDPNSTAGSNPIAITKLYYIGPRDTQNDGVSSIEQGNDTDNAELEANNPPFLAIGFSVFFTALALAALLGLYMVRKRRREARLADDADFENGANAANANRGPVVMMEDPDDIHLLPATEKFDMRSIHDDEDESSARTEDYEEDETFSDRSGSRRSDGDGDGSDVCRDGDVENSASMVSSSLAAMGVASTVVTNMGSA